MLDSERRRLREPVAATLNTIRFGRTTYFVTRVKQPDAHLIPVHFVLHSPRGRRYLLVPTSRRPDRLVAIAPITHFSPYRPTPFGGMWFAVEGGTLVIAAPDA
jgi:hypothetical protein